MKRLVASKPQIVAASLAAMLMAACIQPEPVVVVVTATPTPEERVDDKLTRRVVSPAPSPVADTLSPPPKSTPVPANTPTPLRTSTPIPLPSEAPAPTSTSAPAPTSTPIPTNTPTPVPTSTPTPVPTSTPIPTKTPTPVPTSTHTPTNTPVPVVRLVLDAESKVVGYWSDGTADVEVTATLRNDGALRLDRAQDIEAACDERRDCRVELSLSLPDGFAPASESFTLRLPMGATTLQFDYGEYEPLTFDVNVPQRILGVDRDLWECYADMPSGGVEIDGEVFQGCGGWGTPTVQKWLNDVPVKVWATGHPDYIAVLETILAELDPILGLEFQWVDSENEADFKAFVGVDRADEAKLGFDFDPALVHVWGFAGAVVQGGGEATYGDMVIWHTDLTGDASRLDSIRAVTIHEALHALGPIGHRVPLGHNSRPLSVMEFAKRGAFIPRQRQLLELNSHPLVRPGMSMDDVRELIVLTEELLDYSPIESEAVPDDPLDLIWRAYVELERAGSASFRLSGGWTGDSNCDQPFGVRQGPVETTIGDFSLTGDWPDLDPAFVHLDFGTSRFLIRREDSEWRHWWLSPEGAWETVYREAVDIASSYWLRNDKLLATLRSVLWDGSSEDISVEETADGHLPLQVTLDHSYVYMWDWSPVDESLDFALVVDPETFSVVGYTWELHRDPNVWSSDACLTYKEVATDGRLGVDMDKLLDPPETAASRDALDIVWGAYLALEKAGSASFRLSGGWTDCNYTFGVRRGPIEFSIGNFSVSDPTLIYLDFHTTQFYIVYSWEDEEWTHWQPSQGGAWQKVDREVVVDTSSYWLWNGKLHAAIRSVLRDGAPEDTTVDETADGDLRVHVSNVNMRDWDSGDSLDLTLVMDTETLAIEGYTWELRKNPAANPNACLVYKEVATDGRLGVEIEVPESIRNELD